MNKKNYCVRETFLGDITTSFNIYQDRQGGIRLLIGSETTLLRLNQIDDLKINLNELIDYNEDSFSHFYKL